MESTDQDFAGRLAFWEKRFPGKGAALLDILGPFYGWKPELKPALPDLEARVRAALSPWFNHGFGVKAFPKSRDKELWDLYYDSLDGALDDTPLSLKGWSGASMKLTFGDALGEACDEAFGETFFDSEGFGPLGSILMYPCSHILLGEPEQAAKYATLFELWRAGNCPILFDKGYDNSLVLVAD
ncbi:hypothetical protein HZC53_00615 [Candidatus Uhrbacteria bacterium]|nr:hypothetical protein [Candidatus Uhrbacteria bacterium]